MKNLLIFASVVTLAVAGPHRGLVDAGAAGPAPAPEYEPIAQVPENKPIEVPEPVLPEITWPVRPPHVIRPPVNPSRVITVSPAITKPLVQIIVNINGQQGSVPGVVVPQPPVEVVPIPPEPVDIGIPIVPYPVEVRPEPLETAPEPVEIGVPVVPHPAEILPENLN